ncbi:MAG: hypothetical protein ACJA14_002662 [Ilumatobacter sp.]
MHAHVGPPTAQPADSESLVMVDLQSGLFEISIEQPG